MVMWELVVSLGFGGREVTIAGLLSAKWTGLLTELVIGDDVRPWPSGERQCQCMFIPTQDKTLVGSNLGGNTPA